MASYPLQTSGMASATRILERHNLHQDFVCLNNTKGDGNCFFHAIADQLIDKEIQATVNRRAIGIPRDHRVIRQHIVDFARRSQECLEDDTILNELISQQTQDPNGREPLAIWRDYCRTMNGLFCCL